ncbi:MBL fold metallo-hydrolase RNA specificity domain-containing protein [Alkalisalibacterium limincola]|uniref:MBL fold metallo-hydrolase n=1 Tax=Alkalisalibacterium limincola TaxID=2699169 RepID=A0A5C8KUK0_9GAMM|nr:MBL fold metallo-hydrolase [Alkalisalibacterium limincola]TXK65594.1 MBL fold metallo-hydrolase [Alkalisalibacterium limincola]
MSAQYPHLQHHGAVRGVTGSAHHLHTDARNSLLIDCGLFQGEDGSPGGDANADALQIDFDISTLRALVATHVHIDHVGRIPWLLAAGFKGPILCSEPSAKLLPIVLEDAFKLSFTRQAATVERFVDLVQQRIVALPYGKWHEVAGEGGAMARVRLKPAGHILGSAYVEVDAPTPDGSRHRYVFSGDLGAPHSPILAAPKAPHGCDTLVIESTYGDRNHEDRRTRRQRLEAVLERALQDQGTVMVPAFSIGRTQELLYELEDIIHRRAGAKIRDGLAWDNLPVVLDSPLASRFTGVYRELKPFWDVEALKRVSQGRRPLAFEQLITVDSHADHQRMVTHLAHSGRPAIVIAGSGMCTSGRIVNHLKAMLGDARHDVLFVGYQGRGTPGRAIQQRGQGGWVDLDGERFNIHANVDTIGGYSAHADQKGLLKFVTGMRRWPSEIRVVHGDPGAKRALVASLRNRYSKKCASCNLIVPDH